MKTIKLLSTLLVFITLSCKQQDVVTPPNIIYILADDMGYGDASCYGQEKFSTPNIDKLAAQGMLFTQHYSGATVCAPSRSSLLTGQHTGHTPIRANVCVGEEGQAPINDEAITIAELLKEGGYVTGAFGKWGLGFVGTEGDPYNQGFDEFWGYNCQLVAHRYYPAYLWHNSEKVMMEGNDWRHTVTYAQDVIQDKTLDFIKANKDKQFFAYVPLVLPHAELLVPDDEIFKSFDGKFEEKAFKGREGAAYDENLEVGFYCPQEKPHATFAAMITRVDKYVGEIMTQVEELGLSENTIIMFSSDNGAHCEGGADPRFFNSTGGFKGFKRDLYEGGIRAPFIASWASKIEAGTVSNHISAFWDIMPTLTELAGLDCPDASDGNSLVPTLLNVGEQQEHEYLYWEFHKLKGRLAVRMGNWKGVVYQASKANNQGLQLYDIIKDPTEKNNVVDQYPEVEQRILSIMKEAHSQSAEFPIEFPILNNVQ